MSYPPVFLGVADQVAPAHTGGPAEPLDIVGLRRVVASSLFPLELTNLFLVFAVHRENPMTEKLWFGPEFGPDHWLNLGMSPLQGEAFGEYVVFGTSMRAFGRGPIVWKPGLLHVWYGDGESRILLGAVSFVYVPSPELTEDRRAAVLSNPLLNRAAVVTIRCNVCGDQITPVCAVDQTQGFDGVVDPVWYRDLPEHFTCGCKSVSVPLQYLRESMHWLLIQNVPLLPDGTFAYRERISLRETEKVLVEFQALIDSAPAEEEVQQFIQRHPLLLAPFGASHVFFKPPVLTKYKADFGVVDARRELLLIEIERPSLPILRTDGTQTAQLTAAFGQPHSWRQVIVEHRRAVLESIPRCPTDIGRIRYLVIAGRSRPYQKEVLDRLVMGSSDPEVMTYDHLIEAVRNAVRSVVS